MSISIIIDAVVIFSFIITVYFAYRRGFLHTALHFISYFVSMFIAAMASSSLADWVVSTFLRKPIADNLVDKFTLALSNGSIESVFEEINGKIPAYFFDGMLRGRNPADVAQSYIASGNIEGAANAIVNQIIGPVIASILSVLFFFIIFLICKLVFRQIYRMAGVVRSVPVVRLINGLAGGLLGALEAVLFNVLFATLIYIIIFFTGNELSWLNNDIVEQTNLFVLFYRFNILSLI